MRVLQETSDTLTSTYRKIIGETASNSLIMTSYESMLDPIYPYSFYLRKQWETSHSIGIGASFEVGHYPFCCATKIFYNFKYDPTLINKEELFTFLDVVFEDFLFKTSDSVNNRRVELKMVQQKTIQKGNFKDIYKDYPVPPLDKITYGWFFEYFTKDKQLDIRTMYNVNTSRVIIDMKVVFPLKETE